MKLIIDIPDYIYKICQDHRDIVYQYIAHGTPLDDVKAIMEKQIERDFAFAETETLKVPCHYGTANGLQVAVRILDNIGKAESEEDMCKNYYYNDGEVHAECVICDKMTREEAISILSRPITMKNVPSDILKAHDMAIKALEQEPILDKIRAEIKALSPEPTAYDVVDGNPIKDAVWETLADVLQIIDKYKAESEG